MSTNFNRAQNVLHADSTQVIIVLMTISHDSLDNNVYLSSDPTTELPSYPGIRGTVSNSIEYIFMPFRFIFPNQEADTPPQCRVKIDNISREIATILIGFDSAPTVSIQVVLAGTPDVVEMSLPDFKLTTVSWNAFEVEGVLTVEHFEDEPYPAGRFNPSGFPGLFAI